MQSWRPKLDSLPVAMGIFGTLGLTIGGGLAIPQAALLSTVLALAVYTVTRLTQTPSAPRESTTTKAPDPASIARQRGKLEEQQNQIREDLTSASAESSVALSMELVRVTRELRALNHAHPPERSES